MSLNCVVVLIHEARLTKVSTPRKGQPLPLRSGPVGFFRSTVEKCRLTKPGSVGDPGHATTADMNSVTVGALLAGCAPDVTVAVISSVSPTCAQPGCGAAAPVTVAVNRPVSTASSEFTVAVTRPA